MSQPGLLWRHVVINTHGSWLHGDARGFRSRHHRIHSSGDYRNPPPRHEHAALRAHHERKCPDAVTIPLDLRPIVGRALVEFFLDLRLRVLVVAVGKVHAHAVVELAEDLRAVKRLVGEAKRFSSTRVTHPIPGPLWSAGGKFVPVEDDDHLKAAYEYDFYDQGRWAWTWSFRDGSKTGMIGRKRPAPKRKRR
jgi:hypothetical protein